MIRYEGVKEAYTMIRKFMKYLKGSQRRATDRLKSSGVIRSPHFSLTRGNQAIEVTTDDVKLGIKLYKEIRQSRPQEVVTFRILRDRSRKGDGETVSIKLPRDPDCSSDFVYAEFANRLEQALGRTDYD